MAIDYVAQGILVLSTCVISLIICYAFFENSFSYFLHFETILLILFVALGVIEFYYLAVAILFVAIIIYQNVEPSFRSENK